MLIICIHPNVSYCFITPLYMIIYKICKAFSYGIVQKIIQKLYAHFRYSIAMEQRRSVEAGGFKLRKVRTQFETEFKNHLYNILRHAK